MHQKAERALKYAALGAGKTGLGGMNTAGDPKMGREEQRCEQTLMFSGVAKLCLYLVNSYRNRVQGETTDTA